MRAGVHANADALDHGDGAGPAWRTAEPEPELANAPDEHASSTLRLSRVRARRKRRKPSKRESKRTATLRPRR